jgi:hypothetical protein
MQSHPLASGNWLRALDLHLSDLEEIVAVGRRDDQNMQQLLTAIHGQYRPNRVIAGFQQGDAALPVIGRLARDRGMIDNRPTVYLCRQRTCLPPVTDPEQLRRLLQG